MFNEFICEAWRFVSLFGRQFWRFVGIVSVAAVSLSLPSSSVAMGWLYADALEARDADQRIAKAPAVQNLGAQTSTATGELAKATPSRRGIETTALAPSGQPSSMSRETESLKLDKPEKALPEFLLRAQQARLDTGTKRVPTPPAKRSGPPPRDVKIKILVDPFFN